MSWSPYQGDYPHKAENSTPVKSKKAFDVLLNIVNFLFISLVAVVIGGFFIGMVIVFIYGVRTGTGTLVSLLWVGFLIVVSGGGGLLMLNALVRGAKDRKRWLEAEAAARKSREQERELKPWEGRVPNFEPPPKSKPTFTPTPPEPPKSKPTVTPPIPEPPKQAPPVTNNPPYKQKVPLKKYPGDIRPRISIQLRYGNRTIDCEALIDSGASTTIFHGYLADQLGIDLTTAPVRQFSGVAPNAWINAYETRIEIGIAGFFYQTRVSFSFDLNPNSASMLGQEGFFDQFFVKFPKGENYVELSDRATTAQILMGKKAN